MKKRLLIVDVEEITVKPVPGSSRGIDPKNIQTISQARAWLVDPNNWFPENTRIIRWEGLVPKVSAEHGVKLLNDPKDDGLPWSVVFTQMTLKKRGIVDENAEEIG
jgi:hypothetical protein